MESASNLVLVGPMGSGKSSIGRRLAERYGLAFVDADREVEARAGASVAHIFDREGEAGFRVRERAALAELLAAHRCVIATGGGAVLDPDTRQLLRARGFVVHLHVDPAQQLLRLARDRARPLLARPDREAVLAQLAQARAPLYAEVADLRFDTGDSTPADTMLRLARLLEARWSGLSPPPPSPHETPA